MRLHPCDAAGVDVAGPVVGAGLLRQGVPDDPSRAGSEIEDPSALERPALREQRPHKPPLLAPALLIHLRRVTAVQIPANPANQNLRWKRSPARHRATPKAESGRATAPTGCLMTTTLSAFRRPASAHLPARARKRRQATPLPFTGPRRSFNRGRALRARRGNRCRLALGRSRLAAHGCVPVETLALPQRTRARKRLRCRVARPLGRAP